MRAQQRLVEEPAVSPDEGRELAVGVDLGEWATTRAHAAVSVWWYRCGTPWADARLRIPAQVIAAASADPPRRA
jgi:hypothetical protein